LLTIAAVLYYAVIIGLVIQEVSHMNSTSTDGNKVFESVLRTMCEENAREIAAGRINAEVREMAIACNQNI
jgi:hypothetical protein